MDKEKVVMSLNEDADDISKDDTKVDTTPENDDEEDLQDKVKDAMDNDKELDEDPDKEEVKEKEEDKEEETDEDWGNLGDDEKEEDEEEEEEKDDEKEKKEEDKKDKGEFGGFDTFKEYQEDVNKKLTESQAESVKNYKDLQSLKTGAQIKDKEKAEGEKDQSRVFFTKFCKEHSDVVGDNVLEDYEKFVKSNNNAFIFNNPNLAKFSEAIDNVNQNLPFNKRVELGYQIAFADTIAETKVKQAKVETEMKQKKIEKMADGGGKQSSSDKKSGYTDEQQSVAEQMGVELD